MKAEVPEKFTLTILAAAAGWFCMSNATIKSRSEARRHSKLSRAWKANVMKEHEQRGSWDFVAGEVELEPAVADYLDGLIEERLKAGVPGNHGEGMGDLIAALSGAEVEDEVAAARE